MSRSPSPRSKAFRRCGADTLSASIILRRAGSNPASIPRAVDRDPPPAWLDNLVLRFRDQPMTDATAHGVHPPVRRTRIQPGQADREAIRVETQTSGRKSEIPPEISVISNILENGKPIGGLGDGEAFWHTDSSFVDVPPAASLLRSSRMPAALRRRRDLFPQHVLGLRDLAGRYQNSGSTA